MANVIVESDEPVATPEEFYNRTLALCFAGEGLVDETEMIINSYINDKKIK